MRIRHEKKSIKSAIGWLRTTFRKKNNVKFNELNLSADLLAEIEKAGFVEASPIQEQTIPLALEGKDVIGQAQTGTGKTAAFGLPTLEKIRTEEATIQALVIAPTRELAVQSQEELFRFGRSKGVKVRSVYGGSSIEKQIKALKSGAHIVVGTPGRLLDLIKRKALKLQDIETLILDEADEMLNMGFLEDIEAIISRVPESRQTLLFSATMPDAIKRIGVQFMKEPEHVKIAAKELTTELVDQYYIRVKEQEKFDKDILQNLAKNYEIVVVTGTNGKTLTTALTVGILKEVYGQVLTNPSGANMITGIATTFLTAKSSKTGKNIAVLEIDEASLSRICDYIQPSLFVITNIFRDQMDRYGEIYTTYKMILDAIRKVPTATVLLNGDSPLFYKPAIPNPVQYFGFDLEKGPAQLAHYNTEGILCPDCQGILKYEHNTYANLGAYICEDCGCKRPDLDYRLTDLVELTNNRSRFVIDGQEYGIQIGGLYNIYNALAAVAIARYLGADSQLIKQGFDKSRAVFGRQETFHIGDKECTLVLIKNPVGATQAIEMIKLAPYPFSLSVLLNANYADGIDTSWIWDADFEQITEMDIPEINAGGVRHSEIARRLRVTGYPAEKITETSNLEQVLKTIENQDCKHAYILATYTAMLEFRELLASRQIVRKEMN